MNRSPWFILSASLLLSLIWCPPVDIFFDDREIFSYIGQLIAKGGVPYRDVFDHKPPLIFFINYFGLLLGPWGLWIIDTFLVGLGSLLFFRLCQKFRLAWPWLPPLLFNLFLRNYLVCITIGMTRAYTAIFVLLFFCILLNGSKYRYFWMGLLTAATFGMQQDQITILLPFWAYALLTPAASVTFPAPIARAPISPLLPTTTPLSPATSAAIPSSLLRNLLLALTGALTLIAPLLIWFGLRHSLSWLWQCAFQFNFRWYDEKIPLVLHFRGIKDSLEISGNMVTFLLIVGAGFATLVLKTTRRRLTAAALLAVLFSFTSEYLSGKLSAGYPFLYYLLPLSSTLPILLFTVWAFTEEPFLLGRKSQAFYGFLVCCLPLYSAIQHATHLATGSKTLVEQAPEFIQLRQQQLKDYDFFEFGSNDWIYCYNSWHILCPTRWVYQHIWEYYPLWDADHHELQSIMNDLLRHHTKYVISDLRRFRWKDPSARTAWLSFLQQYYQPAPGSSLLWQIK